MTETGELARDARTAPQEAAEPPRGWVRGLVVVRRIGTVATAIMLFFLAGAGVCYVLGVFSAEQVRGWLVDLPPFWTAAAVFGLLAADVFLPMPSSVLLTFGGMALGWHVGTLVGAGGVIAGNLAGYWVCRAAGTKVFGRLVGAAEAERFGKWLDKWGAVAIFVSRVVPAVAETLSCLAGLGRMRAGRFTVALVLGTAPVALAFALLGAAAR